MTIDSECPPGRAPAAVARNPDGHAAGNRFIADNADALRGAVALIERRIAKAIREAADQRQRAAVMIIRFAPHCDCAGAAPCWDLGLSRLMTMRAKQAGEWGPLRLDETTLILVAQGFEGSAYIQRRASAILQGLKDDWCVAGHGSRLDCAIGIGVFPEDGDCAPVLLQRADEALHDLRVAGQNAAGFNLRRTSPAERMSYNRWDSCLWHRAAIRAHRNEGSPAGSECKAPADFGSAPAHASSQLDCLIR